MSLEDLGLLAPPPAPEAALEVVLPWDDVGDTLPEPELRVEAPRRPPAPMVAFAVAGSALVGLLAGGALALTWTPEPPPEPRN